MSDIKHPSLTHNPIIVLLGRTAYIQTYKFTKYLLVIVANEFLSLSFSL